VLQNQILGRKCINVNVHALQTMSGGAFKSETILISVVGMNQVKVQQMLDRVGTSKLAF
jgi:iron(III) transport system substrate-binding protein